MVACTSRVTSPLRSSATSRWRSPARDGRGSGAPETLATALAGTDQLLLISATDQGQRVAQHENVVATALRAGVDLIAYTSVLHADTSTIALASEHQATEAIIRASGLPYVFLRPSWYLENYTANLAPALQYGAIFGSAGDGRISAATRADYAAAAAAVLTAGGPAGTAYELGGDTPFTMAELAAEVSRQTGKQIAYQNLPADEYTKVLVNAGLPEPYAATLADSDLGIARGELFTDSGHLRTLIGRPSTPLADGVAVALKGLKGLKGLDGPEG
jgi:NAD(P)H dehydrogenase (quinone)